VESNWIYTAINGSDVYFTTSCWSWQLSQLSRTKYYYL